jgi:hypothetical protein
MTAGNASMSWCRRIVVVDYNDGDPIALRCRRKGLRIAFDELPVDEVQQVHASGAVVVTGLRAGIGIASWLSAPLKDVGKVRQILPSILDTKLPFALEECQYALGPLLPGRVPGLPFACEGTAALSVVVRRQDLDAQERVFAERGFVPHAFEHEGLALWCQLPPAPAGALRVIVWCRPSTMLVVLGAGEIYWSSHHLDGHDADRVARLVQLQKSTILKGMYKGYPTCWFVGGDASICKTFSAGLEAVSPESQMKPFPEGRLGLARALAARVLLPGHWRMRAIWGNVGERLYAVILRKRYVANAVLLGVLSCVLVAGVIARRSYIGLRFRQHDLLMQEVVQSIAGYPVTARGGHAIQIARGALADRGAALEAFDSRDDLSLVAGRLANTVAEMGGHIEELVIRHASLRARLWLPVTRGFDPVVKLLLDSGFAVDPVDAGEPVEGKAPYHFRAERGVAL